jgi:hypothetical protein
MRHVPVEEVLCREGQQIEIDAGRGHIGDVACRVEPLCVSPVTSRNPFERLDKDGLRLTSYQPIELAIEQRSLGLCRGVRAAGYGGHPKAAYHSRNIHCDAR